MSFFMIDSTQVECFLFLNKNQFVNQIYCFPLIKFEIALIKYSITLPHLNQFLKCSYYLAINWILYCDLKELLSLMGSLSFSRLDLPSIGSAFLKIYCFTQFKLFIILIFANWFLYSSIFISWKMSVFNFKYFLGKTSFLF